MEKNNNKKTNPSYTLEYGAREMLKDYGWQKYHEQNEITERADGLQLVIFAHFHRSKEGCENSHPEFDVFTQHWLAANSDRYDAEVVEVLIKKFGAIKGKQMIAPGASYWEDDWESGNYYKYVYLPSIKK